LAALGRLRVGWTRASLALEIGDRKQRHTLLRRARREGWAGQRLRFEAQWPYPSRRRWQGGQPRRDPEAYGADVTLCELGQLSRRWLAFYEKARQGVKDWDCAVRPELARGDLDTLVQLLRDTDKALKEVAGACRAARADLAGLRQRAEQRRGRPRPE
jgi:hypothetical protein